jgi:hypothetical protein
MMTTAELSLIERQTVASERYATAMEAQAQSLADIARALHKKTKEKD